MRYEEPLMDITLFEKGNVICDNSLEGDNEGDGGGDDWT